MEERYKKEYYKHTRRGSLSESDMQEVSRTEGESTLKELVIKWLERMPFFDEQYWADYRSTSNANADKFWSDYRQAYENSLSANESGRLAEFDNVFFKDGRGDIPPQAMQAALLNSARRPLSFADKLFSYAWR